MKKFIKDNWFKIFILIIILFCISLFFIYLTKQQDLEKQKQEAALNASCQKLASQNKDEVSKNDSELYIHRYEYKYNTTYKSCIVAYTGSYSGTSLMGKMGGYNLFRIDNLSTGESILKIQTNPGDTYREANNQFNAFIEGYFSDTN